MSEFIIREYSEEDLPAIAIHWKESVKGWPPGFMSGQTEWTVETVREWLMGKKHKAIWLGWIGDKIVGFLSYPESPTEPGVTYVGTFNVHPDYRDNGYGRRLLVISVDRAIADNVKRLDLQTWAANENAVPLYKKCGFFWRPDSSVHMYNFLPAVLNNPLVREFLGDTHWYDSLRQPLEIIEDNEPIDGCYYHRYTFKKNGKRITVLVDPSVSGIAGIISDELTIRCDIPGKTHVAGFVQPVNWTFKSANKPTQIKIACKGSEGLEYSFEEKFALSGERKFTTEVKVAPELRSESIDWHGKPIDCEIEINGVKMIFRPGVRVVRPFKLEIMLSPIRLLPGEEKTAYLNFYSRTLDDIEFTPDISCKGDLKRVGEAKSKTFKISSESSFGFPVSLKAGEKTGEGIIEIGGAIKLGEKKSEISPLKVFVDIAPVGKPVVTKDENPEITFLSNGRITLTAERRGGSLSIGPSGSGQNCMYIDNDEIGEPFSREFSAKNHDIAIETREYSADMIFRAESDNFPGIKIERKLTIGAGDEIDFSLILHNAGAKPFTGKVRSNIKAPGGSQFYMPLIDAIITGSPEIWLRAAVPFPTDIEKYPEPWFAWSTPSTIEDESFVSGFIYEKGAKVHLGFAHTPVIVYSVNNLAPGESATVAHMKLFVMMPNWRAIQKIALNNKPSILPVNQLSFDHAHSPIFSDSPNPALTFRNMRYVKGQGKVEVKFPSGKTVEKSVEDWDIDNPVKIEIPDDVSTEPGLQVIEYKTSLLNVENSGKLPLIVPVNNASISLRKELDCNYEALIVDNGCIEFRVSPGYSASLYRLVEKTSPDKNLVISTFPTPGMWTWFNPWYGGICPWHEWHANFYKSEFKSDFVKYRWAGLDWEGVRISVGSRKKWESLSIELLYLTRPGVPVVLNIWRFTENGGVVRPIDFEYLSLPCPSGNPTDRFASLVNRVGKYSRTIPAENGVSISPYSWAAVYDPKSLKTIGIVISRGFPEVWDAGKEGLAIFDYARIDPVPGETTEIAVMYVIADDPLKIEPLAQTVKHCDMAVSRSEPRSIVVSERK